MSHVVVPNYAPFAVNDQFNIYWKTTRALLAAGWKYKASGDNTGAAKESGTANPSFDRWAIGGSVNTVTVAGQTGTAPSISAAVSGVSTITLLTGMDATYSPGRHIQFTGCTNAGNNGTFRIITRVSATSVTIWNPGAIVEVGAATVTWAEKGGGIAASITAAGTAGAIPGRAIVTGLTGMVAPTTAPLSRGSVGDHLTLIGATTGANNGTFMITRVISATSVEIDNSAATTDASNGTLRWIEVSPLSHVYGAHLQGAIGQGAWLNLQGPSTMKIPVGVNVPTGTFVKGEVINETTSGAQGVILGLCLDTVGGLGYIVVEPRLSGTGGGVRGWSIAADTITGATSGATLAVPNPTVPIEYVREYLLWKSSASQGSIYFQTLDSVAESAYRFSVLATTAAVTAIICPGGATASFPAVGSWTTLGTAAQNAAITSSAAWFLNSFTGQSTNLGFTHIICANCIEGAGVSQDGSFIIAVGSPISSQSAYVGNFFMRCDDGEEGDVDPYVTWMCPGSPMAAYPATSSSRTTNTTNYNITDYFRGDASATVTTLVGGSYTPYKGYRRRGFPTGDAYQEFCAYCLGSSSNVGTGLLDTNTAYPGKVQSQATSTQFIKEPIWIISTQFNQKMRKGTLRWVVLTEGGVSNTTYSNATWVQLSTPAGTGASYFAGAVVGPWDGATIPTNS